MVCIIIAKLLLIIKKKNYDSAVYADTITSFKRQACFTPYARCYGIIAINDE